jgi:hypothetical protein
MPKRSRQAKQKRRHSSSGLEPTETRASEAITIAWTSSVTAVVVADLVVIVAHFYAHRHPQALAAGAFEGIMLVSAAAMGAVSLAFLATAWRARRTKPPRGYAVFAGLVAAAPIIAVAVRLYR